MKKVKVQDAVGLTLCHDITAMRDGFKGAAFKRGHVIEEGDVEKLLDLGKRTVFIWEENAGEIHEEDAARRMAAMAQVTEDILAAVWTSARTSWLENSTKAMPWARA